MCHAIVIILPHKLKSWVGGRQGHLGDSCQPSIFPTFMSSIDLPMIYADCRSSRLSFIWDSWVWLSLRFDFSQVLWFLPRPTTSKILWDSLSSYSYGISLGFTFPNLLQLPPTQTLLRFPRFYVRCQISLRLDFFSWLQLLNRSHCSQPLLIDHILQKYSCCDLRTSEDINTNFIWRLITSMPLPFIIVAHRTSLHSPSWRCQPLLSIDINDPWYPFWLCHSSVWTYTIDINDNLCPTWLECAMVKCSGLSSVS